MGLRLAVVPCFGHYWSESPACPGCQVAGVCWDKTAEGLTGFGALCSAGETTGTEVPSTGPASDPDISYLQIQGIAHSVMNAALEGSCLKCTGVIPKGAPVIFINGRGLYHRACPPSEEEVRDLRH